MKKWMAALICIATTSCSYHSVYTGADYYTGNMFFLARNPHHAMAFFLDGLADDLLDTNMFLSPETPIAVVSFVDVEKVNETNWLGNSITEGMIYQMQRRGFTVIDFKNIGTIRVTEQGDFSLSRDWQQLDPEQNIEYVLIGTMLKQRSGVWINARIVGFKSRVVVASAQGFLPEDRIGQQIDSSRKIWMKNGELIRGEFGESPEEAMILKPSEVK